MQSVRPGGYPPPPRKSKADRLQQNKYKLWRLWFFNPYLQPAANESVGKHTIPVIDLALF